MFVRKLDTGPFGSIKLIKRMRDDVVLDVSWVARELERRVPLRVSLGTGGMLFLTFRANTEVFNIWCLPRGYAECKFV